MILRLRHTLPVFAVVLALRLVLAVPPAWAENPGHEELRRLQERIEAARARKRQLESERQALAAEAARIGDELTALAARAQALEQKLAEHDARIARLERERGALQERLAAHRATIVRLLAALQRLRADPPPPFVTAPDDVLGAVRTALMMRAILPRLQKRAAELRQNLMELRLLESKLEEERAARRQSLNRLRKNAERMRGMLRLKRDLMRQTGEELARHERRLARLVKQARTLEELLKTLDAEQARARERLRKKPEEAAPRGPKKPPARRRPKIPFEQLKGRLPWPAQGERLVGFHERTPLIGVSRGLYLATVPGAVITAPADAKVELAGPFRSYGKLVILDVGEGYRILLAGLHRLHVRTGESVAAGEPVGNMGAHPAPATVPGEKVDENRPILYMELRRKRAPRDPARWLIGGGKQARKD